MIRLCIISVMIFRLDLVFFPPVQAIEEAGQVKNTKDSQLIDKREEQMAEPYNHSGQLEEAREGFAKVTGTDLTAAPQGYREEDYLAKIDSVLEKRPEPSQLAKAKLPEKTSEAEGPEKPKAERKDVKINEVAAEEEKVMEEISGLIIEQTMTGIGYGFYETFFVLWEAPEGIKEYNIFIIERASPTWGSWVEVNVDDTTVWSNVLKPRFEEIEEAVKEAVEVAKIYLQHYEEYQLQSEDMVGNGM